MSDQDRWILHMLGLASRQKKLILGTQPVESMVMRGHAHGKMVFVAGDLSEKIMKRIMFRCEKMQVPVHVLYTVDCATLGSFFGKEKVNAVGLDHQELVKGIREKIERSEEDHER